MAADKLAVTNLVTIELQAGNAGHNRLKQHPTFNKRLGRGVAAVEMQKVEGVKTGRTPRAPSVAAWVSAKFGRPSSPTPHNSQSR